jgi:RNA polymerase sigma-70 factor (ECF subfamily)
MKGAKQMKIQYKFASETIAIEVSDEWGEILIDLDRQEYNNDHKETRRHYHMEGCVYEGDDFAVEDQVLARLLEDDGLLAKLPSAVASLLPRQRRLINQVFVERKTYVAIAREDGVDESAVRKAVGRALKKLEKLLV